MEEADLLAAVDDIRRRLDAQYAATLGSHHVSQVVEESATIRHTARFHNYIVVLVEKLARDRLRSASRATSSSPGVQPAGVD